MPKFFVSRSQEISCPVEQVFKTIRDFHSWPVWSPWLVADPECQVDIQNDWYSWEGEICGAGRMLIITEEEDESIRYDLQFLKPWKSQADVRIFLEDRGEVTVVTWTMDSALPFFLFWMKASMEAFIGMDYERGLLMLKDLVETGSVPSRLEFSGPESGPSFVGVGIKRMVSMDRFEKQMKTDYEEVRKHYPDGVGFSVYYKWDLVKKRMTYLIGVKLEATPGVIPNGMDLLNAPGMKVYAVRHHGHYRHLSNGWSAGMMHGRTKQFRTSRKFPPFEIYEKEGEDPVVKICLPMK